MSLLNIFGATLARDLGTENTKVYMERKGVVLNEASSVALDVKSGEVVAIGNKAANMLGKAPENIVIINPLEGGKISDFDITKMLLKYCLDKTLAKVNLIQPKLVITAPSSISDIEMRALEDACLHAGAREVYIIESIMASAIGYGHDTSRTDGKMIVNFGAGNTEIAIVSMNGIVFSKTLKKGGNYLNYEIIDFIYDKYSLVIGHATAKELKEAIGRVDQLGNENPSLEISGRDALSGMPVSIDIFSSDVREAIIDTVYELCDNIVSVLEKNPPELSRDILKNGIYITGGGSQLRGLDKLIENRISIKVTRSSDPCNDAILGAGEVISNLNKYKNIGK